MEENKGNEVEKCPHLNLYSKNVYSGNQVFIIITMYSLFIVVTKSPITLLGEKNFKVTL